MTPEILCSAPKDLVVHVNLPGIRGVSELNLDITARHVTLSSDCVATVATSDVKSCRYELKADLPFSVNPDKGKARFDKTKSLLKITLPVIGRDFTPAPRQVIDGCVSGDEADVGRSADDPCRANSQPFEDMYCAEYEYRQTESRIAFVLNHENIVGDSLSVKFEPSGFNVNFKAPPPRPNCVGESAETSEDDQELVNYSLVARFYKTLNTTECTYDLSSDNLVIVLCKDVPEGEEGELWYSFKVGQMEDTLGNPFVQD